MLILSRRDLESLNITTNQIVDSLERLIRERTKSRVWAAPKAAVTPPDGRFLMATLSAAETPELMAVKSLVLNPKNPEKGLPAINSLITLLDSDTGEARALVDGNWVTALRTACASVVAAKRMANSDASVVTFIGCGVQANSHLDAYSDIFDLSEVRAFGRGEKNKEALCLAAEQKGLKSAAYDSAEEAVEGADLVVSSIPLTAKVEPFIDVNWLKPGVFVSSTDMALPFVPKSFPVFDRIIIDDIEQEASMPKPMVSTELVYGDITSLVMGEVVGRQRKEEKTAFIFRAVVLGDLALSALAYETAIRRSVGTNIAI